MRLTRHTVGFGKRGERASCRTSNLLHACCKFGCSKSKPKNVEQDLEKLVLFFGGSGGWLTKCLEGDVWNGWKLAEKMNCGFRCGKRLCAVALSPILPLCDMDGWDVAFKQSKRHMSG